MSMDRTLGEILSLLPFFMLIIYEIIIMTTQRHSVFLFIITGINRLWLCKVYCANVIIMMIMNDKTSDVTLSVY